MGKLHFLCRVANAGFGCQLSFFSSLIQNQSESFEN